MSEVINARTPDQIAMVMAALDTMDPATLKLLAAELAGGYVAAYANWQEAEKANNDYVTVNNDLQEQVGKAEDAVKELRAAYDAALEKLVELEAYRASTEGSASVNVAELEAAVKKANADVEHLTEVSTRRLAEVEAANKRVADLEAAMKVAVEKNADLNRYAGELERIAAASRDSMGIIKPAGL